MEAIIDCPLGSKCEYIGDDKRLHRCAWHVKIAGTTPQGESVDEWRCAIAWQPILMLEMSAKVRGTSSAIESLRNETVKRQDAALQIARGIPDAKVIESK